MTRVILISLLTVAICLGRAFGLKDEAFQAVAHLYVGGLFGAWLERRDRLYLVMFAILCVVEVVCFARDHLL